MAPWTGRLPRRAQRRASSTFRWTPACTCWSAPMVGFTSMAPCCNTRRQVCPTSRSATTAVRSSRQVVRTSNWRTDCSRAESGTGLPRRAQPPGVLTDRCAGPHPIGIHSSGLEQGHCAATARRLSPGGGLRLAPRARAGSSAGDRDGRRARHGFGGGDGIAALQFAPDTAPGVLFEAALQADGRVVMIFNQAGADPRLRVVRFNPDGSRDTSFGTDGSVVVSAAGGSVVPEPDGQVDLVLHYRFEAPPLDTANPEKTFIVRMLADGTPDRLFNANGFGGRIRDAGRARCLRPVIQCTCSSPAIGQPARRPHPGTRRRRFPSTVGPDRLRRGSCSTTTASTTGTATAAGCDGAGPGPVGGPGSSAGSRRRFVTARTT